MALILGSLFLNPPAYSQDESGLFTTSAAPDALIVLDLSGSMLWTPVGAVMYTHSDNTSCIRSGWAYYPDNTHQGYTKGCTIDPYGTVPKYSDPTCSGPFYTDTANPAYTTDCSRLAIAKRAIFNILDENHDNIINSTDEQNLNIRFGYMRFYNCYGDDTGGSYSSGCNSLIRGIGSRYSRIYCNSYSSCSPTDSSSPSVNADSAYAGTPLSSALREAKLYLDYHKSQDTQAAACRKKFVILITDGADTFSCSGNGSEDQTDQYKRRRRTVAKTKELADAGYKVFVVGFGAIMPHWARNTLNWAAYYGGTDNPLVGNSGNTSAYNPSSVTECGTSTTDHHNIEGEGDHYYATSDDPGELSLAGYAFIAYSANDLVAAVKMAIDMIREATYSFTTPSVSSQRTQDENYIYEASFNPLNDDPFWRGHLTKYYINSDGSVGSAIWNSGDVLASAAASTRNIITYKGALTPFSTANITREDLGVSTDAERDAIVGYIRGESTYNPDLWKLGDIYHSNPISIGTPSGYFEDTRDTNHAFADFRQSHERTSANGLRIIVVGTNEGQFHAFKALDGSETWSFIPPNFLPKLKNIAHATHPTGLTHQYFTDGAVSVADVWLGSGDGTSKSAGDWKTLVIFGEGRGGSSTLWSSSTSCDSGFNPLYSSTYPSYCGYYALDVTATTSPVYKWRINPTSAHAPYLGEPWSKVAMGRVKISGQEKWVGFFGGGYNASDCAGGGSCDSRGKGFFVVDLIDGSILWSYTRATDLNFNYSLAASPSIADTDNDGFIDTVYIGGLGGSVWRFKFCTQSDGSGCGTSNWSGGRLFASSTGIIRPIYTTPTVFKDDKGNLWVAWGTGDKTNPTDANAQEKFFAVKDNNRSSTFTISDLENITSGTYADSTTKNGWYMNLSGGGEKMLGDPVSFGGVVYFTTYTPPSGGDACSQGGTGTLYGISATTGGGIFGVFDSGGHRVGSSRTMTVGTGIPSAPILSMKPVGGSYGSGTSAADVYLTVSGGGGSAERTTRVNFEPPTLANRTNLLYWKDRRLE